MILRQELLLFGAEASDAIWVRALKAIAGTSVPYIVLPCGLRLSTCSGCDRLWREYAAATVQHVKLENYLKLAALQHDISAIERLTLATETAAIERGTVLTIIRPAHSWKDITELEYCTYFDSYPTRDAAVFRVRISDRRLERVTNLESLRRAESAVLRWPWTVAQTFGEHSSKLSTMLIGF